MLERAKANWSVTEICAGALTRADPVVFAAPFDTYYQFTPGEIDVLENAISSCQEPPEGLDEVLATVLQFDSLMQSYYRHAAQMAPNAPVRELFENLADAVEEKERKETRNAAGLKDI